MERSLEYKNILAESLGIDNAEFLNSIISDEELKYYCLNFDEKNFMPGIRQNPIELDSHNYCYLKSGEFKANLHCHTRYSDGLSDVENLLNKANEIAETNGFFLFAITDHDSIEGTKEALQIISKNPDKYKKLKVVLGLEISTVAIHFKNQQEPVSIHLLVYGINPFDKKLNDFLNNKRKLKLKLAYETIDELNKELSQQTGIKFSIEEAALVHEMIAKGQDEVSHPLKKYTAGKILHNYYCPDSDFTYEKPIKKYKYLFKSSEPYYKIYKHALEKYINHNLEDIPHDIEKYILRAKEIYEKSHPSMNNMPDAFSSFEETVKFISTLDYGYMSIAHPARTNAKKVNSSPKDFYTNIFENFTTAGGKKACFYEGYYQSYDGETFLSLIPDINTAACTSKLICTGGLDSHGLDVIIRCPYT